MAETTESGGARGPAAAPVVQTVSMGDLIEAVAEGLKFDPDTEVEKASGGERRRAALARLLAEEPDLMLLDEPTNHLDIDTIAWLEDLVLDYSGTVVVVTHDRAFLQQVATRIVELDRGRLTSWPGDYRNYRERDGVRFSHIIDPRSGWPIRHRLASVTVVHPQCMIADALATALLVLGPEEGWELALRDDLAVLFLAREGDDFTERMTPRFAALLEGESYDS